jgi:hypothetical protein
LFNFHVGGKFRGNKSLQLDNPKYVDITFRKIVILAGFLNV